MSTQPLNALSKASSAYLRSAMHQPVHWHEWGEEAFAAAQRENKPILLDIGAVWCHWCHVMDRESYDNPEIAQIVNERFIAVKVDRDERPDIDSRYQVAVSSISGQGGWPLTAFLTPDGKPFYGGTYFPPADHYGRPSFKRVLLAISDAYREKHGDVIEQAKLVEGAIAQAESLAGKGGKFSPAVIKVIVNSALKMFDPDHGGFGSAPKFPHPSAIDLLIDQYVRSGNDELRQAFVTTLDKMAHGGVYDQLGGGFHRYSVDERWVVPHFEKMCYDNSELLKNYVHAYQATGAQFFADIAHDIIRWMDEWLSDREHGGFYASQDADFSMDDDGDYFTWTLQETRDVLSDEEARIACPYYDINEIGEMHHDPAKNVLYVRASVEEIARRLNLPQEQVDSLLQIAKQKMYAARLKRPTPYVDKTVYTGWNALCISAYLEAAKVLKLDEVRHFALRSLDRILAEARQPGGEVLHVLAYSESGEERDVPGVLEDYAFTVNACLDAYESTSDLSYFDFARRIADTMLELFFDPNDGGFFDTGRGRDGTTLGVLDTERKPFQDSPTPAGNPVAAIALLRLHAYTNDEKYRVKAEQTIGAFAGVAGQYGLFAATYAIAGVHLSEPQTEVVVIGNDDLAEQLYGQALKPFSVTKAALRLDFEKIVPQNLPPALADTLPELPSVKSMQTAALICSGFTCQPPISDPEQLARSLGPDRTASK
ncbi:MAG TPA: thioredoxin domain-containing protein [Terriglobales bacterium]|nr:thioredoxin domain-containing protein [Terriglobales bacterium]